MLESASDWLFGIPNQNGAAHFDTNEMSVIYEGELSVYGGFTWQTNYWRIVWRDEMKSQAMLLRSKRKTDHQLMKGKMSCIPLATIKTLVPLEEHELSISGSSSSSKRRASVSSNNRRIFRIALETVDGSTLMLAASSPQSRLDWLHVLYSNLIQQAREGLHQDASVIDGIQELQIENEKQLAFAREIDEAMKLPINHKASNEEEAEEESIPASSTSNHVMEEDLLNIADFN
mmetsp:Transcript_22939/g.29921  ORF Transcript_22939/g.29921 Transcript_22939/m.29921 type:complete len:232 (+) Transcript_22939:139-834(+)